MEHNRMALVCAFALLFLSFGCVGGGSSAWTFWVPGWYPLFFIALAIVALLQALGYMFSAFIGDDKMKAFVKKELGQLVISVILILVVTPVFILGMNALLQSLIAAPGLTSTDWQGYVNTVCSFSGPSARVMPCHMAMAMDFLQTMYSSMYTTALSYFMNNWFSAFLSYLQVGLNARVFISVASLSVRPFAYMSLNADMYSILFDLAMKNIMLLRVQEMFLTFLMWPLFPVMLSIGLVLRTIYFSRKLGGLLIALALAAYFVFPMFYVMSDAIFFSMVGGWQTTPVIIGQTFDQSQAMPFMQQPLLQGNFPDVQSVKSYLSGNNFVTETDELDKLDAFAAGAPPPSSLTVLGPTGQQYIVKNETDSTGTTTVFNIYNQSIAFQSNPEQVFSQPVNVMDTCGSGTPGFSSDATSDQDSLNLFAQNWQSIEGGALVKTVSTSSILTAFSTSGPMASLAAIMVLTLITPFLAIMTTLAAFKVLSGLLGGDVEIALLSRLL